MKKWLDGFIEDLRQIEISATGTALDKVADLKGDLKICEEVISTYLSIWDCN